MGKIHKLIAEFKDTLDGEMKAAAIRGQYKLAGELQVSRDTVTRVQEIIQHGAD